jgi:hypothetical protein
MGEIATLKCVLRSERAVALDQALRDGDRHITSQFTWNRRSVKKRQRAASLSFRLVTKAGRTHQSDGRSQPSRVFRWSELATLYSVDK